MKCQTLVIWQRLDMHFHKKKSCSLDDDDGDGDDNGDDDDNDNMNCSGKPFDSLTLFKSFQR